jgi:ribosomal protein S26
VRFKRENTSKKKEGEQMSNYITCPKCKKMFHIKAGECPTCKITPEQYQTEIDERHAQIEKIKELKERRTNEREFSKLTYCTACGSTFKKPRTVTKGSLVAEIVLWLLFLFPGLIYSVWRHSSRYKACPECQSPTIIPATSPKAKEALGS